jgi:hypothetical protein
MTGDLAEQLRDAEARVEHLKRRAAAATCVEMGEHDWVQIGGCNAGCHDDPSTCGCSVPVHECSRCKDCDYGENPEAERIVAHCLATQAIS